MSGLLGQLIPAQGQDIGDWGEIAVLVVMAVLWAVGGLAKNLTKKTGGTAKPPATDPRQPSVPQRPASRAPTARQPQPRPPARPRPVHPAATRAQGPPARPVARTPAMHPPMGQPVLDAVAEPLSSADLPHLHTGIEKTSEMAAPVLRESAAVAGIGETPQERQAARRTSLPIIDPADRDSLRRAILHYEIFGRPVGSRDPMGHPHTWQ